MSGMPVYVEGAELGDLVVTWLDDDGDLIDFSSGYTFSVKVGHAGTAATFTKTSGITGAATAPNLTIGWSTTGELNLLTSGKYMLQVTATRSSDSKVRIQQSRIEIRKAVT